jgi:hypothetical protein
MSRDSRYIQRLGELPVFHEIINRPEELTEENFDDTIMAFQEKADIRILTRISFALLIGF